jgi:hypothetical protein
MVKVYIWEPTNAIDISDPFSKGFEKMHNPTKPHYLLSRSVGHCAVHLENSEFDVYFSLYPAQHIKDIDLLMKPDTKFSASFSVDIEVDIDIMESRPKAFYFANLDENLIASKINAVNNLFQYYKLSDSNCASLALKILHWGTHDKSPSLLHNAKTLFNDFSTIFEAYSFMQNMEKFNKNSLYSFKPVKTAISILKVIGYDHNPYTVLNYCEFLKEELK